MSNTKFYAASLDDVDTIIEIIRQRIDWMDEKGLEQWNCTHYLEYYPRSYFEEGVARGDFYLMERDGKIIAEMALFTKDGRWDDDPHYFYVHHLATRRGYPGAGGEMLHFAEELGRKMGKKGIRLDSAVDNEKLNAYYEALDYPALTPFVEDEYEGLRRVKYLDMELQFREAAADDLEELWEIEAECFPPQEMCLRENFEKRLEQCPEHFLLLTEKNSSRICGFIGDIYTSQKSLTDDMFTGDVCHEPDGKNLMVLGLNVRPEYQGRGFGSMLMQSRLRMAKEDGIKRCVLTCHDHLVGYYQLFGYQERGISQSVWGNEQWYDMVLEI